MNIKKHYVALTRKSGTVFLATIECQNATCKDSPWRLEIRRELNGGGLELVRNDDFTTLRDAKRAMETWRKGLKWMLRS